jgi:hypothetical protein
MPPAILPPRIKAVESPARFGSVRDITPISAKPPVGIASVCPRTVLDIGGQWLTSAIL